MDKKGDKIKMAYKIIITMINGQEYELKSKTLNEFESRLYNEMAFGAKVLVNGLRHFVLYDESEVWINPSHISSFEIEEYHNTVNETIRKDADYDAIRNSKYYNPDVEAYENGLIDGWGESEGIDLSD
ncbi:hypothetical protein MUN88_17155 [Gracilibacillus caseinilyticus]|uniref:Uncharacterized protein n=1 Tax=Gracilibacillus caseinilyticus TaxID=2932256 RepID=A0ABY4EUL5_9BACI|nr:hypothetical protein [Gracilibacillus caseinilyticus]UOQ47761.1 hypothetical protein MUN88_17155 [Gracilibacillus caseinilyticus]